MQARGFKLFSQKQLTTKKIDHNYSYVVTNAVKNNNKKELQAIAKKKPYMLNSILHNGKSALHIAVESNYEDIVRWLVEKVKVDINMPTYSVIPTVENKPEPIYADRTTPVHVAIQALNDDSKILNYLLEQGADSAIPDNRGITPLISAIELGSIDKVRVLANSINPNVNQITLEGKIALTQSLDKDPEITKLILGIPGIDVNLQSSTGDATFYLAHKLKNHKSASLIMQHESFDYEESRSYGGQTAQQLMLDTDQHEIAREISTYKKSKRKLNIQYDPKNAFQKYTNDFCANYTRQLYRRYLNEDKKIVSNLGEKGLFSYRQSKFVDSKRIWNNVLSETEGVNQLNSDAAKEKAIQRFTKFYPSDDPEKLYADCMRYLQDQTLIILTFDAVWLNNKVKYWRPINVFETDRLYSSDSDTLKTPSSASNAAYTRRYKGEMAQFAYLSDTVKQQMFQNKFARPHYAVMRLISKDSYVDATRNFGDSFVIFKNEVRKHALFAPGDSLAYTVMSNGKHYDLCTVHHFEFLLAQCPDKTLKAIVSATKYGTLNMLNQNQWDLTNGGYIEVKLPQMNLLDSTMVEYMHIHSGDYVLTKNEIKMFQDAGITVNNEPSSLYQIPSYNNLISDLVANIKNNNDDHVMRMVNVNPSLLRLPDNDGKLPIHHATERNSVSLIQKFQEMGARLNSDLMYGKTPLRLVASTDERVSNRVKP